MDIIWGSARIDPHFSSLIDSNRSYFFPRGSCIVRVCSHYPVWCCWALYWKIQQTPERQLFWRNALNMFMWGLTRCTRIFHKKTSPLLGGHQCYDKQTIWDTYFVQTPQVHPSSFSTVKLCFQILLISFVKISYKHSFTFLKVEWANTARRDTCNVLEVEVVEVLVGRCRSAQAECRPEQISETLEIQLKSHQIIPATLFKTYLVLLLFTMKVIIVIVVHLRWLTVIVIACPVTVPNRPTREKKIFLQGKKMGRIKGLFQTKANEESIVFHCFFPYFFLLPADPRL